MLLVGSMSPVAFYAMVAYVSRASKNRGSLNAAIQPCPIFKSLADIVVVDDLLRNAPLSCSQYCRLAVKLLKSIKFTKKVIHLMRCRGRLNVAIQPCAIFKSTSDIVDVDYLSRSASLSCSSVAY